MNNESNIKIIYKKLINYDNDSSSTYSELNNQINLDKITNNEVNIQNTNLDKYHHNFSNSNERLRNNILKEINSNNSEKYNINKKFSINIKNFFKYLKNKNIDLTKLNEQNILSNSIKLFIIENNLNKNDTFVFLKEFQQILDINANDNIEITNKLDLNIENFQTINLEQQNKDIFELLKNNDINAWLFMGCIFISFIIIIMIIIHNK